MARRAHGPVVTALLAAALLGCASAPPAPPVAVAGPGLASFAGEWRGEYWSADTGRRGLIRFALAADGSGATGDVWMSPAQAPRHDGEGADVTRGIAQALPIRFVRVGEGGTVSGTMEPYRDPECGCMLTTTFTGVVSGDRIRGRYTAQAGPTHPVTGGEWAVERVPPAPPGSVR